MMRASGIRLCFFRGKLPIAFEISEGRVVALNKDHVVIVPANIKYDRDASHIENRIIESDIVIRQSDFATDAEDEAVAQHYEPDSSSSFSEQTFSEKAREPPNQEKFEGKKNKPVDTIFSESYYSSLELDHTQLEVKVHKLRAFISFAYHVLLLELDLLD
jgi:hypothetical protein